MSDEQNNSGSSGVINNPVNYDVPVEKLTPSQAQREKDFLYAKDSPYWKQKHEHPDSERARERVQKLVERENPVTDEDKGLTEGDRQLLGVLRSRGTNDEMTDKELKEHLEDNPSVTVEDLQVEREFNDGLKTLKTMHGEHAPEVIESAQGLLKLGKEIGMKKSTLEWIEKTFSNDPETITLMGILGAKIAEARSKSGVATKQPKKEFKSEAERKDFFIKKAKQLLNEI